MLETDIKCIFELSDKMGILNNINDTLSQPYPHPFQCDVQVHTTTVMKVFTSATRPLLLRLTEV